MSWNTIKEQYWESLSIYNTEHEKDSTYIVTADDLLTKPRQECPHSQYNLSKMGYISTLASVLAKLWSSM